MYTLPDHRFLPDCEAILKELPAARPAVVLRPSLSAQECAAWVRQVLPAARQIAVVMDANTRSVLGERVQRALGAQAQVAPILLPGESLPTLEAVRELAQACTACDALVAVGSGTINDLCKFAAYMLSKSYLVFPTAPSMNGYTSANASLLVDGHKQSLPCQLPVAVLCDLAVLTAAPKRLIRAGLGDSLARPTAQADWLISHLLLDTAYDPRPYALLEPYEGDLFRHAEALTGGDMEAVALLMHVLLLSGFGMTLAGGSHPASQGEHMIAHAYELLTGDRDTYHGEQIGMTALYMARVQEYILRSPKPPALAPLVSHSLQECMDPAYTRKRALIEEKHDLIQARLAQQWPEIRARIMKVIRPSSTLEAILAKVEAPATPHALGWDPRLFSRAVECARFTRDRFTFLDFQ